MAIIKEKQPLAKRGISNGIYQKLSNKLDSSFVIKQRLLFKQLPKGEFLHITANACNVFVFVSATTTEGQLQSLDQKAIKALLLFQQKLLPAPLLQHARLLVPFLIIAANDKNQHQNLRQKGFYFLNKSKVDNVIKHIKKGFVAKASPSLQLRLKFVFNPETFIPESLSQSSIPFLDDKQELLLRYALTPLSITTKPHSNIFVYQGVAGSGKSLILAQQAKLLKKAHPNWKILLLAADKPAQFHLEKLYQAVNPNDDTVELIRFRHWCRTHTKGVLRFLYDDEALEVAHDVINRSLKETPIEAAQLIEEINYAADRNLSTQTAYLAADRHNMPLALDDEMKNNLWKAMQDFAFELRLRRSLMPCHLPVLLWNQVLEGEANLPQYDAILVDGAQNFAPTWFQLLHKALRPQTGRMIIMADLNQGSLSRHCAWQEADIDAIECETYLSKNYRTPPAILKLAKAIASPLTDSDLFCAKRSTKNIPLLLHIDKNISEEDILAKEVKGLLGKGVKANDMLILLAGEDSIRRTSMDLRNKLGITISMLSDPQQSEQSITIASLNDIAEVESPIVFIVGLQHMFTMDNDAKNNASKKAISDQDLRKLYTGIMRTKGQLILLFTGDKIPDALKLKALKVINYPVKRSNVHYISSAKTAKNKVK